MPKWEDIRDDLFEAIIQVQPAINKEQQSEIVELMRAKGHDMGWNAIRYKLAGTMAGRRVLQNWDAETHEAILLALIEHMKPTGGDWSAVVASLHGKGHTFTEGALVSSLSVITITMSKQPTSWDHEAHLALLQAVIAEAPPQPAEWDKICSRVATKGYTYTASAAM
ncbi:hypothetical protein C8A00DRAFT_13709 [Chaetomidium leptoderma]|uniref:Uncharacterized protein n=1 Tax=Chaetomidium leptoderma TaxID=669021 RepID=A0AAN6VP59_9PEZI|nr:hypothetical protein C8A00DRAFT_13709 [Chaetomidium leptoderma]